MSDKAIIRADAEAAGQRAQQAEKNYQDSQRRVDQGTASGRPLGDQSGRRSGAGEAGNRSDR